MLSIPRITIINDGSIFVIFRLVYILPLHLVKGVWCASCGLVCERGLDFGFDSRYHHNGRWLPSGAGKITIASIYHPTHNEAGKGNIINKASNGTRSNGETSIKGLKKPIPMRACALQHPLQNRVPRVQVLLPLPSKNGLNMRFKPFFLLPLGLIKPLVLWL